MTELQRIGVRITTEGAAEYRDAMRQAALETKAFQANITTAKNHLQSSGTVATRSAGIIDSLGRSYKNLSGQLDLTKNRFSSAHKEQGNLRKESEKLSSSVKSQRTSVSQLEKEWQKSSNAYKQAEQRTGELREAKDKLRYKIKESGQATEEESKALTKATAEWRKAVNDQQRLSKTKDEAKDKYMAASEALQVEEKRLNQVDRAVNNLDKEIQENIVTQSKLTAEMAKTAKQAEAEAQALIKAGGHYAERADKLEDFGNTAIRVGSSLKSVGSTLTDTITKPLLVMGTAAVAIGMNFEQAMSRVGAVTGATKSEFSALTEQAKTLGASTIFSATEVAQGMEMMGQAGFDATQTMDSMAGVLDLAAVSGKDVALASESMATAINSFGLSAKDATRVANVYAQAAVKTNAEVRDMAHAMKYVAPSAKALNLSIEETAAAIGVLSDAGLKGSTAGTSFNRMLIHMTSPTNKAQKAIDQLGISFTDMNGEIKPIPEVIDDLSQAFEGMTTAQKHAYLQTIFGTQGARAANTLIEAGSGKLRALTGELENSAGAADKLAKTMNDNLAGTIEEMMGALETASITITEALAPVITQVAEKVTVLANKFSELSTEQQMNILKWVGLAAAAGPALSTLGNITTVAGGVSKALAFGTRKIGGYKMAMELAGNSSLAMMGANKGLVGSFGPLTAAFGTTATKATAATSAGAGLATTIGTALPWALGAAAVAFGGWVIWDQWGRDAMKAADQTHKWGWEVGEAGDQILTTFQNLNAEVSYAHAEMADNAEKGAERAKQAYQELGDSIKSNIDDSISSLAESFDKLPEHVKQSAESLQDELTKSLEQQKSDTDNYTQAIQGIYQRASDERRQLTDSEKAYVSNATRELAKMQIESANLTAEQRSAALRAYNREFKDMSYAELRHVAQAAKDRQRIMRESYSEEISAIQDHYGKMKEQYQKGSNEYNRIVKQEQQDIAQTRKNYYSKALEDAAQYVEARRHEGVKEKDILAELKEYWGEYGITIDDVNAHLTDSTSKYSGILAETLQSQSEEVRNANAIWNQLVFDEKIANLDSNAKESIEDFIQTEDGWNQMKLVAKDANIDSNTKEFIIDVLKSDERWNSMSLEEKIAIIETEGGEALRMALVQAQKWNDLKPETKEMLASTNVDSEIVKVMTSKQTWDAAEFAKKLAEIDTNAPDAQEKVIALFEEWSGLELTDVNGKIVIDEHGLLETGQKAKVYTEVANQVPESVVSQVHANENNVADATEKVKTYSSELYNLPESKESSVFARIPGLSNAIQNLKNWMDVLNGTPENKNSQASLNTVGVVGIPFLEMWSNLLDQVPMEKSSTATMQTVGALENTPLLSTWNNEQARSQNNFSSTTTYTDAMLNTPFLQDWINKQYGAFDTYTGAYTFVPGIQGNTGSVLGWNSAQSGTFSTSTTASTSTNAPGNTRSVNDWTGAQHKTINTSTKAQTATNAPGPTSQVKNWTKAQKDTRSTNTRATTSTNANHNTGKVRSWTSAIRSAPRLITSTFRTVTEKITNFIARHLRTGSPYFEGGSVWLGDGHQREPYLTPQGEFGVSDNNWEMHHLPKGTRVWPNRQAFRLSAKMNSDLRPYLDQLPKFAKGGRINNPYDGYTGLVGEAGPELFQIANGKVSITPISHGERTKVLDSQTGSNSNVDMTETNDLLKALISLIASGQDLNIDGQSFGKLMFPYMDNMLSREQERKNIMTI